MEHATDNVTVNDIISLLRRLAQNEQINPALASDELNDDTMVYMLSLDSIDMVTLYASIDAEYGISVPDDGVNDIDSLKSLAEKLNSWRG